MFQYSLGVFFFVITKPIRNSVFFISIFSKPGPTIHFFINQWNLIPNLFRQDISYIQIELLILNLFVMTYGISWIICPRLKFSRFDLSFKLKAKMSNLGFPSSSIDLGIEKLFNSNPPNVEDSVNSKSTLFKSLAIICGLCLVTFSKTWSISNSN